MRLVWNAIVKNERAIIDRCVKSLAPHIEGAVIVDTGSADGTPERLEELFDAAGLPIRIKHVPFENFEQARNAALQAARESDLDWDYLLLADADMELNVHRPNWINGARGLSYDLKQTAGSLGYYNRRLLHRRATGAYVGVTHEYLDVASDGTLDGAEFVDHADGANRPEKYSRDIALLEKALETESRPGLIQRYHFYLAGSYYDAGNFSKAAKYYALRVGLGGFDQEVWYARYRYALCMEKLGSDEAFVIWMLNAYQTRPSRVEPLYELARYYREKGDNHASSLFSKSGMQIPMSDDALFVNEWIYKSGLREEFAICAYYDSVKHLEGAKVCNQLALQGSEQARSNLYWYLQPLGLYIPSFKPARIKFTPPEGWVAMNPSVINYQGKPLLLVRTVNYTITPEGVYEIRGPDNHCNRDNPICTRSYLGNCADGLKELALPANWPAPKYSLVRGFEDSRLFEYDGKPWTVSTVRELNEAGWCTQILAPLTPDGYGMWGELVPKGMPRRHEKNWMPWVEGLDLKFVYRLGTVINTGGEVVHDAKPDFDVSHISGGSQVITAEGLHLALVHEARSIPGRPHNRYYQHRFVVFGNKGELVRISPPFVFHARQIEFAAGLAYFPDNRQLMVSYGVCDCEAWLAAMDFDEVVAFIAGDAS